MLKIAAYSKIAVEAGIIPADQMRRIVSQFQAAGGDTPFEAWALSAGVLDETAIDRLRAAYGQATFRCAQCQSKFKGDDLVGEINVRCPSCGHDTLRRVRSSAEPAGGSASAGSSTSAVGQKPDAALAATVQGSRDSQHKPPSTSETAFEINASGSPSDSAAKAQAANAPTQGEQQPTVQATSVEPRPEDFERGLQPGQRIGNWEITRPVRELRGLATLQRHQKPLPSTHRRSRWA